MKMKANAFSAIILCATLFLTSCQKEIDSDSPPPPPGGASAKIKTYTEDLTYPGQHSVETYNLTYDSQHRLTAMESVTTPGNKFFHRGERNK